jgi:hypothetical protein
MSLNQQLIAEFSPCTPSAPQLRDLSIQTLRPSEMRFLDEVAVGTIIADRPPHRSVRALISAYGSYLG